MESITWEGTERMLRPLSSAQALALEMACIRHGSVEEDALAIACAALGMSWTGAEQMPDRAEHDSLVAYGGACLDVFTRHHDWTDVVPDAYRWLKHVRAPFNVTEAEAEEAAGNSEAPTGDASVTG